MVGAQEALNGIFPEQSGKRSSLSKSSNRLRLRSTDAVPKKGNIDGQVDIFSADHHHIR